MIATAWAGTTRAVCAAVHGMVEAMLELERLRPERMRPLLRDDFEKLIGLGAFEHERVELLRGVLVTMSPQQEPHARVTSWLDGFFHRSLDPSLYEVRAHTSYAATRDSVPEPDVQVLSYSLRRRLPRRALLLIEVNESSEYRDRVLKPSIYAENRAPEYWVVDLKHEVVWVHTRPTRRGYGRVECLRAGDVLRPLKLPAIELPVSAIPWAPREPGKRRSRKRR